MDEFLQRALAAGLGLAVVAGPLGCLVVWRRMAYFGDTIAHAALLGVVAGLLLGADPALGVVALAVAAAVLLAAAERDRRLASDTLLGILSHGALAAGLVALSLMEEVRVNLMTWLLGDILAVTWTDAALAWGGGALVLAALALVWRALVAAAVDEDLAAVEGHRVGLARLVLMVLVALLVAVALKVVGALLATALLIIPAAAARPLARTPEQMALLAAAMGMVAVAAGLGASWRFDTPSGPSIVVAAVAVFVLTRVAARRG
ncbi:iron chelate uptake ABC transporter family permease subunit [Magnetospirillum sp. UT-4]|uniref:iron chelate uptake ABC transporter family permease subunit n=1 Tax=Magnetospirillum sp. UT-4 TaxID=2681467 RepID=UPI001574970E|nr:iron chelate uptake ABC transporter family permease subunit [Magnetospirillum sp. UT-4]